jgi:hypothetical protein
MTCSYVVSERNSQHDDPHLKPSLIGVDNWWESLQLMKRQKMLYVKKKRGFQESH